MSLKTHRVPFDGSFRIEDAPTDKPKGAPDKTGCERRLAELVTELSDLQERFYAHDRCSLLLVFQAMDAAGKDGTIRAVMSGVNPAGCQVYSFKQPSKEELDHDFLWRTSKCLPERGRIGIFNRSYYEEVLVVRVHPEYLGGQQLPGETNTRRFWEQRYQSIRDHEQHLARNGTLVLKFFLHVSKEEQRKRFLARLAEPDKHWKFAEGDLKERALWDDYMAAYETALNETSREHAPWYAIPADSKSYMRMAVAETVVATLREHRAAYPEVDAATRARFAELKASLERE
jgi:PPK2 family polyphosphate:nucleotide phosphotransferase